MTKDRGGGEPLTLSDSSLISKRDGAGYFEIWLTTVWSITNCLQGDSGVALQMVGISLMEETDAARISKGTALSPLKV